MESKFNSLLEKAVYENDTVNVSKAIKYGCNVEEPMFKMSVFFKNLKVLRLLITAGDINKAEGLLEYAVEFSSIYVIRELLKHVKISNDAIKKSKQRSLRIQALFN